MKNKQKGVSDLAIMGVLALIMGGVVWYVHGVKADRDKFKADNKTLSENYSKATTTIDLQNKSLAELSAMRKVDAETLKLLTENNSLLASKFDSRKTSRANLENTNVQIKGYLDQPVPADLQRLLDKSNSKYYSSNKNTNRASTDATAGRPAETIH